MLHPALARPNSGGTEPGFWHIQLLLVGLALGERSWAWNWLQDPARGLPLHSGTPSPTTTGTRMPPG